MELFAADGHDAGGCERVTGKSGMRPSGIPVPVRSWPRWSRRIPTRIAHGIGHGHARVFMDPIGNKAVTRSWRLPHRTSRPSRCAEGHAAGDSAIADLVAFAFSDAAGFPGSTSVRCVLRLRVPITCPIASPPGALEARPPGRPHAAARRLQARSGRTDQQRSHSGRTQPTSSPSRRVPRPPHRMQTFAL